MKIYTKTGDTGETGLVDGSRVAKDHPRVAAYGEVDELNAALGVVRACATDAELDGLLHEVQKELFALGAQLADPKGQIAERRAKAAVGGAQVARLERAIDERQARLPPLTAFLLPSGTPAASFLHLARTVCRRAERAVVRLSREQLVEPLVIVYLNRLSDLLFVLARSENHANGKPEDRW